MLDFVQFATYIILFHAAAGGLALASGLIAIVFAKGGTKHKAGGKVFYYSLICSGISALIITSIPGHYNMFLFVIGIFSLYLTLSGRAALKLKKVKTTAEISMFSRVISSLMLVVGIAMIIYAIYSVNTNLMLGILLFVFGGIGTALSFRDLLFFSKIHEKRKSWLAMHIGNMTGAYIAAFTAFMVVNELLPPLLNWLLPTLPGSLYIIYWIRKTKSLKTNLLI